MKGGGGMTPYYDEKNFVKDHLLEVFGFQYLGR